MRATRVEVLGAREEMPLVIRARFEKTFFGLGAFAAVILLVGGAYLMTEVMIDPMGASDVRVLGAGFALALSSFLLVYFVWPKGKLELAKRERMRNQEEWESRVLTVYGETVQTRVIGLREVRKEKTLPGPM
ncbi:MAG: hypothetical protein WBR26_05790 [Candidatus Acidiferrum sp.]